MAVTFSRIVSALRRLNIKILKQMFETQSMDRSFDFNVILDEKEENSTFYETEDEFPDDVLVRQDSIMCYSSRGAHKHNYDQFDFVVREEFVLAAVYDGHGGPTVSLYLKENLLRNVLNHPKFHTDPSQSLTQCIKDIEEEVIKKCAPTCGSTLLIVLWTKAEILVASVGDGLCYGFKSLEQGLFCANQEESSSDSLSEQNCKKVLLNEIHNLENENQRGKVKGKGGVILKQKNSYRVAGQLCLSRSIGDQKYKEWITATPSLRRYRNKFSHIVLASDGFGPSLKQISSPSSVMNLVENLPFLKDNSTFVLLTGPGCLASDLASASI